jgi:hypothetical protein
MPGDDSADGEPPPATTPEIKPDELEVIYNSYLERARNDPQYTQLPHVHDQRFLKALFAEYGVKSGDWDAANFLANYAAHLGDLTTEPDTAVLWSGGRSPANQRGASRETAEKWLLAQNLQLISENQNTPDASIAKRLYHTIAMTDAGINQLNYMWGSKQISPEDKDRLGLLFSMGFVANASGRITICIEETNPDSFFRWAELPMIIMNDKITEIREVKETERGFEEKIFTDKAEWYQQQRNQWINSLLQRHAQVERIFESADVTAEAKKVFGADNPDILAAVTRYRGILRQAIVDELIGAIECARGENPVLCKIWQDNPERKQGDLKQEKQRINQLVTEISTDSALLLKVNDSDYFRRSQMLPQSSFHELGLQPLQWPRIEPAEVLREICGLVTDQQNIAAGDCLKILRNAQLAGGQKRAA